VEYAVQHANMDVVETLHPAARCESIARKCSMLASIIYL
jgi:hypothetical protein